VKTREQKRQEAKERQEQRAQRTPDEQLAVLRKRGVFEGVEYERLISKIDNGQGKLKEKK
jgi:hypothetical protein